MTKFAKQKKKLIYQVYVGKKSTLYDHCIQSVRAYAKRIGADWMVQTTPILMITPDPFATNRSKEAVSRLGYLPIFEKENAFNYLKSYDQVCIIDADVFVRENVTESIFDQIDADADFAGVLERDMPCTSQYSRKIANYSRMQYGMSPINKLFDWNDRNGRGADFYNMGVMLLNKSISKYFEGETPQKFLRRPRFKAFIDGAGPWKWSTDQTLLNVWIKEEQMKVTNLSYKWNGLYTAIEDKQLKNANFVHFFLKDKLPNRGEDIQQLMSSI